jgi:phage tail sheath gpL-like
VTISFNEIPNNLRVPLFYAEFDNTRAVQGGATQEYNILLIGNKLPAGTKNELEPFVITSKEQAQEYFGIGSVLADMAAAHLANNTVHELTCIAIDDDGAANAAAGNILFAGTATKAGTVSLMIGGKNIRVGVAVGDTAADIATALADEISASENADLVVSGVVNGVTAEQVDLTAKNAGEHGNEIDVRASYFAGEELPAGISATITALTGGTANPDVDQVWPVIGDKQYILMVTPWTDAQTIIKMETELLGRFGPLEANDGYALYAKRDSLANLQTLGNSRNSQFTTIMGMEGPSSPWAWASALAGQVANSASIDPARPFQTLRLVGILAPSQDELFTLTERNLLLFDGIATYTVDSGSNVLIEAVITTYKENAFGAPDPSYLYLNTLLTLSFLRFDLKARITLRYPRHKLADDGTRFDPGIAIVTPNGIKAEIVTKFREWEAKGLVEGFDQFKNDLIVERNADNPNRVDVLMPPDLVNQLRIVGTKIQFLL